MTQTTNWKADYLPEGYRILGDGKDRYVLVHDNMESCPVFTTPFEAIEHAKYLER